MPLREKIATICREIYGADGVDFSEAAERRIEVRAALESALATWQHSPFVIFSSPSIVHVMVIVTELHFCGLRVAADLHGQDAVLAQHGRRGQGRAHWLPSARQRRARRCGGWLYLP